MDCGPIQSTEITSLLSKAHNWKSLGNNQIQTYWLKAFPDGHGLITKYFTEIMVEPEKLLFLANHKNNLFATKIRRQQVSQKL
jgi:hypothetical protein